MQTEKEAALDQGTGEDGNKAAGIQRQRQLLTPWTEQAPKEMKTSPEPSH